MTSPGEIIQINRVIFALFLRKLQYNWNSLLKIRKGITPYNFNLLSLTKFEKFLFYLQSINAGDYSMVFQSSVFFSMVYLWLSFFCLIGDMVTSKFASINNALYDTYWYRFPVETQKMMIVIIPIAQKPIFIRGMNNTICTRFVLAKVNTICYGHRRLILIKT